MKDTKAKDKDSAGRAIDFLIFFVTSKCNSNCKFCFYKDRLNRSDDLSFEEIKAISEKMGHFSTLLFSGGEPFLRKDLREIIDIFVTQNKVKIISIPTNGIEPALISSVTANFLNDHRNKGVTFAVNVSIDALGDLDASLRGRNDAFPAAIETLKELGKLKPEFKNFYLNVNSVFSNKSAAGLPQLLDFIAEFDTVDFHDVEVIRPKTIADYPKLNIELRRLKEIHLWAAQINSGRLKRRLAQSKNIIQRFKCLRSLIGKVGYLRYAQKIKERFLAGEKNLFRCTAAETVCVIDSDGSVRLCELTEPIGNLREYDYSLPKILASSRSEKLHREIMQSHCNCTHACFIGEFIDQGLKHLNFGLFFAIIGEYLKFAFIESRSLSRRAQEKTTR
jgi:MoaA/NifB/PqqE/SkfB family radical SAM enzyme